MRKLADFRGELERHAGRAVLLRARRRRDRRDVRAVRPGTMAQIEDVNTLEEFRNRGLGRAVVQRAADDARRGRGARCSSVRRRRLAEGAVREARVRPDRTRVVVRAARASALGEIPGLTSGRPVPSSPHVPDRIRPRPRDPRFARQPHRRGRRHARRRRVRPCGGARPAPRPASTRRSSCATATTRASAARACCRRSPTCTGPIAEELAGLDAFDQRDVDRRADRSRRHRGQVGAGRERDARASRSRWRARPPTRAGCRSTATSAGRTRTSCRRRC